MTSPHVDPDGVCPRTISLDTDLRYHKRKMPNTNLSVSGPASAIRRATGARGGNPLRRQGPLAPRGAKRASFRRRFVALIRSPQAASTAALPPLSPIRLTPSWRLALRDSRSGYKTWSASMAGGRGGSSPIWPWRTSCCASASGAWRISSFSAVDVAPDEPRPLGLHRADLRAPLGC
jgi:hypothetical protein